MTPIPPARAIAIASSASVTVSIAAETIGVWRVISLVNLLDTSTVLGRTSECAGISNTSSKVSPSIIGEFVNVCIFMKIILLLPYKIGQI
jgi:hypothetical protein